MNEKMILVTGATGRQGGAVIRALLDRSFKVRAITRDPEKPSSQSLKSKGVEVFKGDMEDIPSLHQAMQGVYGVFSVQNYWEKGIGYDGEIRQARNLMQVASNEKVSHFVQSSLAGCDNAKGVEHFESKWEIEKMIDALHLPRTFIRVVFFMENFLANRKIFFPGLAGALRKDTRFHMISVDDIGWFVADAFANPAGYLGKAVEIAGDSLTIAEIKQVYNKVTGKTATNSKLPFSLMKILSSENARQLQWNNEIGWRFDIQKLRTIYPEMISFEKFLKAHPQIQF
jgi:uncharacterized protein YbjT (DUF2867 family)